MEAILSLSENDLEATFALGAIHVKDNRWRPAEKGEKADKSFSRLLKARPKPEKDRYLKAGYSRDNYTDVRQWALLGEDAPTPPKDVTDRYSDEARERDAESAASKPLWQSLREIERGLSGPQRESIRRRIEAGRRKQAA